MNPSDAVTALTLLQLLDKAVKDGYSGVVVNPAGPAVFFSTGEITANGWEH